MDPYHVEVYRHLRDFGKPYTQQDAADYVKIRTFGPPDPALLKRITRAQLGLSPQRDKPARAYPPKTPDQILAEKQRDFYYRMIAQMGGSLTIKPAPGSVERPYVNTIPATRDQAMTDPFALAEAKRKPLARAHMVAMSRRLYVDDQPDMFEVLENFGSFAEFRKDIS